MRLLVKEGTTPAVQQVRSGLMGRWGWTPLSALPTSSVQLYLSESADNSDTEPFLGAALARAWLDVEHGGRLPLGYRCDSLCPLAEQFAPTKSRLSPPCA